jgi:hypothetical protein
MIGINTGSIASRVWNRCMPAVAGRRTKIGRLLAAILRRTGCHPLQLSKWIKWRKRDQLKGRKMCLAQGQFYLDVGVDTLERRQSRDQPVYEEGGVAAYRQNRVGLRCDQVVSRTCDPGEGVVQHLGINPALPGRDAGPGRCARTTGSPICPRACGCGD